jgi:hypothetical protein
MRGAVCEGGGERGDRFLFLYFCSPSPSVPALHSAVTTMLGGTALQSTARVVAEVRRKPVFCSLSATVDRPCPPPALTRAWAMRTRGSERASTRAKSVFLATSARRNACDTGGRGRGGGEALTDA